MIPEKLPYFRLKNSLLRLGCFFAFTASPYLLQAQFVWDDGGTGDDWSTGLNWVGDTAPPSASTTELEFGTGTSSNNDNAAGFIIEKITFEASLGGGDFDITGNQINFQGTRDIDVLHTGTASISNDFVSTGNIQVRGENGGTLTMSGDINPVTAAGQLTKFGEHTLILSGNNQFTGRIRIRGGILESTNSNAIDAPEIRFEDDEGGGGRTPTLRISTNNQTFSGFLRAEAGDTGRIDVLDGLSFTVNGTGNALLWSSAASEFIKEGNGTLILEKTSSGDGTLTVSDGTVRISNATALGSTTGGTTVSSGGTLDLAGGITVTGEALTLSGTGHDSQGALHNFSGNNTFAGNITLAAASTVNTESGTTLTIGAGGGTNTITNGGNTLTIDGAGDTVLNSAISGTGGLTKTGNGTTTSNVASTYTGTTNINDGTLLITNASALGDTTNGTSVTSGGTLDLSGGITVTGETLNLAGTGHAGQGALRSLTGSNAWNDNITLTDDATITSETASTTLTIGADAGDNTITNGGNTITIDGAGDTFFNSQFSGTGGLVKNGEGTATLFFGNNSDGALSVYTGSTTVNAGTLVTDLGNDGATVLTPLTGAITIGDGVGTDTLSSQWQNNIGDSTTVTVNSSGVFQIDSTVYNNDIAETIGGLALEGGSLVQTLDGATSVASIVLNGNVTRSSTGNTSATIAGNLDLGVGTRSFDVADSTAASDLEITATISNGSLTKTGAGNLTLSGSNANTYTGTTTVSAGELELNKTAGTNAIAGDVAVNGGTLLLSAANQIADTSDMTLGGGTFDTNGNNESLGTLTLSSSSTIDLGSASVLDYDASISESWSGTLTVTNWNGDENGGGTTQLIFGTNAAGLTLAQVDSIRFINPTGFTPGTYFARILASGEVVPVIPEPSTVISGVLLSLFVGVRYWLRRRKARSSAIVDVFK